MPVTVTTYKNNLLLDNMNQYYCYEQYFILPNEIQNQIIKFLPEHPIITNIYGNRNNRKCIICSYHNIRNMNTDDYYCQHNYCDYCLVKNYILQLKYKCKFCNGDISSILLKINEQLTFYGEPF